MSGEIKGFANRTFLNFWGPPDQIHSRNEEPRLLRLRRQSDHRGSVNDKRSAYIYTVTLSFLSSLKLHQSIMRPELDGELEMASSQIPLFWTWKGTSTSITGFDIRSHSHAHLITLCDACSIAAHISANKNIT